MIRLKELRLTAGLTQTELANKLGTTQRNVSNWENGSAAPDVDTIIAIADFFDETTDFLLGREYALLSPTQHTTEQKIMRLVAALSAEEKDALLILLSRATE